MEDSNASPDPSYSVSNHVVLVVSQLLSIYLDEQTFAVSN